MKALYQCHVSERETTLSDKDRKNPSLPDPIVPTLTDKDTSLGPSPHIGSVSAYSSPWIDLGSSDRLIASISRQVLNLEVAFASWCGVRSIIVPGPRKDQDGRATALYARAIQETFDVANRVNIIIHMPMYREPGLEENAKLLTTELLGSNAGDKMDVQSEEIDLFGAWDTWNTIRSVCNYEPRLYVGMFLSTGCRGMNSTDKCHSPQASQASPRNGASDKMVRRAASLPHSRTQHLPIQQDWQSFSIPPSSRDDFLIYAPEEWSLVHSF